MLPRVIFEPEHDQFRESVRRFFRAEIEPNVAKWRAQGYVDRSAFTAMGAQGYLLMWADEAYGGLGVKDLRFEQIIWEENMRHGDPGLYSNLHSMIVAPYLGQLGTPEQRRRYLPKAVSGHSILAIAMTEPAAGSDLAGMKTRAERRGDRWILNGSKTYISNGTQADLIIVAARTIPDVRTGIGLFIVEADSPGFKRGNRLRKLGLDAQDTAELFFQDVQLTDMQCLGDPATGFKNMARFLPVERLMVGMGSVAHAQVAFDITLDFVKERRAFGRPIGAMQNTRFKMAELRSRIDAAQAFVDQAIMLANGNRLTTELAAEVKLCGTELEGQVIDECLQLHGGAGYMEEQRISRMYRDARMTRIAAGSSEIMKEIIGRGLGLDERKLV